MMPDDEPHLHAQVASDLLAASPAEHIHWCLIALGLQTWKGPLHINEILLMATDLHRDPCDNPERLAGGLAALTLQNAARSCQDSSSSPSACTGGSTSFDYHHVWQAFSMEECTNTISSKYKVLLRRAHAHRHTCEQPLKCICMREPHGT